MSPLERAMVRKYVGGGFTVEYCSAAIGSRDRFLTVLKELHPELAKVR